MNIFESFKIEKNEERPLLIDTMYIVQNCKGYPELFFNDIFESDIIYIVQTYKSNPELFFNDIFEYCSSSN